MVAGCLSLALVQGLAQNPAPRPSAGSSSTARSLVAGKARALEARGRPDLSVQEWQQVLLADPGNVEALVGLARDLKLTGSDKAGEALDRLRAVSPHDPNIPKIQALSSTGSTNAQLGKAGELARQGRVEEALRIYRQLYGDQPPDGEIGMSYYQILYSTLSGKQEALDGMRAMALRNPGDPRLSIEFARMLTYEQKTRAEGIRILRQYPRDATAQSVLRQALIWDSANPASAAELRAYLKEHPQDTELSGRLKENEGKLAEMNSGMARTPAERTAFAALNAKHLDEAEKRFTAILDEEPGNGRAAAGMGFLRMQQNNFGDAINYLHRAVANGMKDRPVVDALATSRFWFVMGEAAQAFRQDEFDVASAKYREALVMRPSSPEALNGLAGLLTKQQQYAASALIYEQLIKVRPTSTDGWRGLFLAWARDNQNQKALAVIARSPTPVKAELAQDPEYLRTLASLYRAENRTADAQRVLAQALALPFPDNGSTLKADTKAEYAGILMESRRFDQAVALYTQMLTDNAQDTPAWIGLVNALHEMGQDTQALANVQRMPPAVYESALADPGFLAVLGAIYQQANQYEVARGLLERAAKLEIAAGGQPSVALQLQLAGIYLQENDTVRAYGIYRQVLQTNPDRADAWKGLIAALAVTHREPEALQQIALIPAPARKQLDADIEFVQTEGSLYAATGDTAHAIEFMSRVQAHYVGLHTVMPAPIEIQNAWLLFNIGNDRALYPALMRLGSRADLTTTQRETVQDIWAVWSVHRAALALDNGNLQRSVDILDAASQAFPDNLAVRKAVAGGYVQVGRARESLALYKTIPMQDAGAGDFEGAVGAALAANDKPQAELWLRQALERFPRDPAILSLAARYEQARGDNQRAAEYYRASLAAMPSTSPTEKLAHVLVHPDQDTRARRAYTEADLQHLLDPNYEPFQKTTRLPPLPSYGADPYDGSAPVVLPPANPSGPSLQQPNTPQVYSPPADTGQPHVPPLYVPQSLVRLRARTAAAQLRRSRSRFARRAYTPPSLVYATLRVKTRRRFRASLANSCFLNAARSPRVLRAAFAPPQVPVTNPSPALQLSADAPHSQASDAWKGLVFSLMAGSRNAEALDEIAKIPPDVRRQLEADIEFVQGEATLYAAVGDLPHATESLNRIEAWYALRRADAPAALELQHAWLLYNVSDDRALYPALRRLDARADLTPALRQQVETLWASFAVRRAAYLLGNGYQFRGVQLLQVASEDYPNNITIRRALAGAYARVGRAADALALFKAIPMDDAATSGDYQGAIGAALGAADMAQAEAWLRQGLVRYPGDPRILGLAARFEQARGNTQRAADFWRASLAAMPPGSAPDTVGSGPGIQGSDSWTPPPAGEMKRLLDPRIDPGVKGPSAPALPAYGPNNSISHTPNSLAVPPSGTPRQNQGLRQSWSDPLPLPASVFPADGQAASLNAPSSQTAPIPPPTATPRAANPLSSGTQLQTGSKARPASTNTSPWMGKMNLPPSEETVDTVGTEGAAPAAALPASVLNAAAPSAAPIPEPGLRIAPQPMDPVAAQAQALFADQTDGQLTQGSASAIHNVPNAPVGTQSSPRANSPAPTQYDVAQYTPSAQEAATGAYSAPKQQIQQPVPPSDIPKQAQPQCVQQVPCTPGKPSPRRTVKKKPATTTPTLGQAPAAPPADPARQQTQLPAAPPPVEAPATDTGLTDDELEQRNLPPLRGPWVRMQRRSNPISPRDEAEMQLRSIEAGYSPWLGGAGIINYRSGSLGYDHLAALEAPFEVSTPLGFNARLTVVAKPVFLDSGQADGTSTITVQESTTAGTQIVSIPQPIGTLTGSALAPPLPAQQNAVGIGGEVQLVFPHLAIAGGYTPEGFLVATVTGRAYWKPGNGPITLNFSRDPVRDTQLSYSGLRDPSGDTLGTLGQIWGGVTANSGQVQFARGDAESGFYIGGGGQYLTGYGVQTNNRVDGSGGAYWRLKTLPEYGSLSIGANFFGMHYAHNEDAFTHGMGGYFSPQSYFLANVPFTWAGHYGTRWHYNILGSLGVQAFQEDLTPLWPLAVDKPLETALDNAMLPAKTSVGPNYDIRSSASYQIGAHWFAGGFISANNSRNYSSVSAGFSIHYMFRTQPSTATGPTGIFPTDGLRPFTVP